jgi:hypothetical protein
MTSIAVDLPDDIAMPLETPGATRCEPPTTDDAPRKPAWRDDAALLTRLASW